MAEYRWNEAAGRFINERGQFVRESTVRSVVDKVADQAGERMAAASQRLLAGEMSLAAWQTEMQAAIKVAHTSTAVIAHGGAEQMTPSRWGSVGQQIRSEYGHLREFAAQVADGRQPLDGRLLGRARQYGQASRVTFEREYGRGQQMRGYRFERNVLAPAEHCGECLAQTARGWVPVGTLVPIGRRQCRGNCRCSLRYRREQRKRAAA